MEVSNQGAGKLIGINAFIISATIGVMANGLFRGEVNSVIKTADGDNITMKSKAVSWQSEKNGITRASSIQSALSTTLECLKGVICLHEYVTGLAGNWTGRIYRWK
jgi:hypothetical protein